jgi:hypothetical protein
LSKEHSTLLFRVASSRRNGRHARFGWAGLTVILKHF